jgi:glycosyltransferase involved in cell wall biosynthesis
MASGNGHPTKYLNLIGVNIPEVGYGKMVQGLRQSLSQHVTFDDLAEHTVFALRPNMIKGWHKQQTTHLLTMWETNWLPPEFSMYLNKFKTILVPSLHNWELFSRYHDNVRVIPLAVDRTIWHPQPHKPNKKFKLLCGGSEWYRKSLDVVLEVFNKLQLPDAELHIKIVPPHLYAPKDLEYPNVIVHREWMTVEEERNLVASADAFISISRGEGFGLMPLQAISAGIPTILSDAHGHKEFSDLATHRIPTTSVPTSKGMWQNVGDWDEPDQEATAEAIKDIYNNRDKYRQQAQKTAPQTEAFNWDTSAKQLLQIVKPSNKIVPSDWVTLEPTCQIQVKRAIKATIGTHNINFKPNVTYTVVLNVREVLKQSGYLLETS